MGIEKYLTQEEIGRIMSELKNPKEVELFLKSLQELVSNGTSEVVDELISVDYVERPVDMETFLKDPYYLGIIDELYPRLVDDLLELFDPGSRYFLVLLGGSIGWGKSTFAEVVMARIIYEVSCYRNPQRVYGMMESDKMFFANVSVTLSQAKRVVFEGLKGKIKKSEYFRKVFPYQEFAAELRFPNNILVAAATQAQVLGMNTFSAIMDEANFMTVTEGSASMKLKGRRLYDQAEVIFQALYRRMETRFMKRGILPGKLIAISSAQYPDDFMERKIEMYRGNPHAFIRNYAVWETVPSVRFLGETFRVFFNRETGMGRIAEEGEKPSDEEEVIDNIPIEYRHDFEVDIEGSLRDLAGRSTAAIEPFIMRRDKIYAMCDPTRRHGYSLYETTLRDGGYLLKDVLCDWYEERDEAGNLIRSGWRPKVNPKARRVIHIDPALSMDSCGFIMGHVSHWEERKRVRVVQVIDPVSGEKRLTREVYSENLPIIWIDLILRIVPPPNGEIILADVRQLIFDLSSIGFRIGLITMDSFQSRDTMQMLAGRGYRVEELSVDTNIEPYNRLRLALYEDRILAYTHDVLIRELKGLERNKRKGKVDHPRHGCFTGDTRVALLDGTMPSFEELYNRFGSNNPFFVYTVDEEGINVGVAHNPRITREKVKIIEIILDNYHVIKCTPDHLFMLTDGSYVEAKDLTTEMPLMPLYRRRSTKGGWLDYEFYYDPIKKERRLTHQLVAKWKYGEIPNGMIIHHKDGDKGNNNPENIIIEDKREHARRHTSERHLNDKNYVEKLREGHKRYRLNGGNEKSRINMLRLFDKGILKRGREKCAILGCENISNAKGLCGKHYQFFRRQRLKSMTNTGNHRILFIKEAGYADVWDITVEKTHNFALGAGVFVHNSKDLADALAGVVYNCETKVIAEPIAPSLGIVESPVDDEIERKRREIDWLLDRR